MIWDILYDDNIEEWNLYLNSIQPYFNVCRDKTVLEIGPYIGIHSQVILSHEPKELTLVEANHAVINTLTNTFSDKNVNVIHDDIFFYLEETHNFDVVVCCGVLYHLHAPLYLLELIVNRSSPQYLILETFTRQYFSLDIEDDNSPGARQLVNGWKSVNMSIKIPKDAIINGMNNMGYRLKEFTNSIKKPHVEASSVLFVFEKI
jgi:SAM-dependent methyltransferase